MICEVLHADGDALLPYRDLTNKRGAFGPMVIEGITALERLVAGNHPVHSVLVTPATLPRLEGWLPENVPRLVASAATLRALVGYAFHRGVLALAPRPVATWPSRMDTLVVAERITDPSNIGALVRNARALGADALWCDAAGGDPFGRKAIRTAMGCCFHIPIMHGPSAPALEALLGCDPDIACVAATCDADATALPRFAWPARCALFVGNEGYGLSEALLARADARVRIPMMAGTDSLNVAAATAVLLYHRMAAAPPVAGAF